MNSFRYRDPLYYDVHVCPAAEILRQRSLGFSAVSPPPASLCITRHCRPQSSRFSWLPCNRGHFPSALGLTVNSWGLALWKNKAKLPQTMDFKILVLDWEFLGFFFTVPFTKFLSKIFSHVIKWVESSVVRCSVPCGYKINLALTF